MLLSPISTMLKFELCSSYFLILKRCKKAMRCKSGPIVTQAIEEPYTKKQKLQWEYSKTIIIFKS